MGDAGEGLIDSEARIQERMDELQQERQRRRRGGVTDPVHAQRTESLRLALADLQRQLVTTPHETRKQQLRIAVAQVEGQLKSLAG